ncbi:MAG: hypothetical protein K0Q67_3474, partial [Cellvibrio sp.]|nr:hypothetical protein [Cellvibrio sp.]
IGGFTFVDLLQISFLNPAVVRVNQSGVTDLIDIVGYGFHDGLTLTAYPSGAPEQAKSFTVDNDKLRLYSAQRMSWRISGFETSYRGFVDIELSDASGRRFVAPNALFMGKLDVAKTLEHRGAAEDAIDTLKLPPGRIVGLASDPALNLIYVLGAPVKPDGSPTPATITQQEGWRQLRTGWISLVNYDRAKVQDAAPMHGLGYFDLPNDLDSTALALGDRHLYVAAEGYNFPFINTTYENQRWILVYDRETRRLSEVDEENQAKDRDIVYSVPLPISRAPRSLVVKDGLLIANAGDEGVVVLSIADPLKPAVVKVIHSALHEGASYPLSVIDIAVLENRLYVTTSDRNYVFDLSLPSIPQLGAQAIAANLFNVSQPAFGLSAATAKLNSLAFGVSSLELLDAGNPNNIKPLGRYVDNGFPLQGGLDAIESRGTMVAQVRSKGCGDKVWQYYLHLLDTGRPELIEVLDAVRLTGCDRFDAPAGYIARAQQQQVISSLFTDDGLVVTALPNKTQSLLTVVDTLIPEFVTSNPTAGSVGVARNQVIKLQFTHALQAAQLDKQYLSLLRDNNTSAGVEVAFTAALDPADAKTVLLRPTATLDATTRYRIKLNTALGSRRTRGLVDHEVHFTTASGTAPALVIKAVTPSFVNVGGGNIEVDVENTSAPAFLISGEAADIVSARELGNNITRYTLKVPAYSPGAATITAVESDGRRVSRIGAVQYVEPLLLDSIAPKLGSANGGTRVTLTGKGFQTGAAHTRVYVGDTLVAAENTKVISPETLEFVTPPGKLGLADVRVELANGQTRTLGGAFDYQQPVKTNIEHTGGIYHDIAIDPSGTYLFAAAGSSGVMIYHIDSSKFISDAKCPINPDNLLGLVDCNRDGTDDRIVSRVELPEGYHALGVDAFFENNQDRL